MGERGIKGERLSKGDVLDGGRGVRVDTFHIWNIGGLGMCKKDCFEK